MMRTQITDPINLTRAKPKKHGENHTTPNRDCLKLVIGQIKGITRKIHIMYRGTKIRIIADFVSETVASKRKEEKYLEGT